MDTRSILALWLMAVPAVAGADTLDDRVGTLALDSELDARGRLGGVAVDQLGFIYVANFRDAVWRISPEGEVTELSRSQYGSSGIAVGLDGDVYQANFFGDTIDRIGRNGDGTRFASDGLQGPVGIAVAPSGDLYVCNCRGNYISRVSPAGRAERLAEGDLFACPNGIVLGPDGALYVTNFNHHDLVRVDPASGEATVFATVPGGAGNAHIAFSRGFFYVTKIIANRLVKVSLEGEVFALAGTGQSGAEDGPGPQASFSSPNGIAVAPAGDLLYVNTVVGTYSRNEPSSIALRTVDLVTLSKVLDEALESGGIEALAPAFEAYRADPVRGKENVVGEMITYAYGFLSTGRYAEGLEVFELNAAAHPSAAAAQYQLGEAYRYGGRTDAALAQYRKALALDPEHAQAAARLSQLGG